MFESKYIKELKSYKLSSHRAWELAVTNDVLKLDWNEATVSPSPLVFERILIAIQNNNLDLSNVNLSKFERNNIIKKVIKIYDDLWSNYKNL